MLGGCSWKRLILFMAFLGKKKIALWLLLIPIALRTVIFQPQSGYFTNVFSLVMFLIRKYAVSVLLMKSVF